MNLKKTFFNILSIFTIIGSTSMIQSSGFIPLHERWLMNKYGLLRAQAINYLALEDAISQGLNNEIIHILKKEKYMHPFLDLIKDHFNTIKDENGNSILHIIVLENQNNVIPTIQVLLEAGADINTQNNDGNTILHLAIKKYNQKPTEYTFNLIRFILDPEKTDADIDLFNKNGESPRTLNSGLISAIIAEQHEIKHNQALKDYENYQKSKIKEEDYVF